LVSTNRDGLQALSHKSLTDVRQAPRGSGSSKGAIASPGLLLLVGDDMIVVDWAAASYNASRIVSDAAKVFVNR
jgi:hypothetical protein